MVYYINGRTIPGGTSFRVADPHETIESALAAAELKMSAGASVVWIVNHEDKVVLNAEQVRDRLRKAN